MRSTPARHCDPNISTDHFSTPKTFAKDVRGADLPILSSALATVTAGSLARTAA
jgi:hypothetical protein